MSDDMSISSLVTKILRLQPFSVAGTFSENGSSSQSGHSASSEIKKKKVKRHGFTESIKNNH